MEKDLEISLLYDIYGNMLTERQREVVEMYYSEDLSLGEIAEQLSISRQSVRDCLVASQNTLNNMENNVKYLDKSKRIQSLCKKGLSNVNNSDKNTGSIFNQIIEIIEE